MQLFIDRKKQEVYRFKYPYIYYFFVAKKLAEKYSSVEDVRIEFEKLVENLHREDYANILIFITHHTKEVWVMENITQVLNTLFDNNDEAKLHKSDFKNLEDLMLKLSDVVIEQRVIKDERAKKNKKLDEIDRRAERARIVELESSHNQKEFNELERASDVAEEEIDEDLIESLSKVNKTFKSIEIAGQIIRNRHSTLHKSTLQNLARCGIDSGLRFLDFFMNLVDESRESMINLFEESGIDNGEDENSAREKANKFYVQMVFNIVGGIVLKVGNAIGSKEASVIYEMIEREDKHESAAISLIRLNIELQYKRSLNIDEINKIVKKYRDNIFVVRLIKELVVQHIYMFPVKYQDKQKLSEILNLSVKGQRRLDQIKRAKQ
ncbi:MAG: hypothetical protein GJ680_17155 [Alteromonadaceae bacterium]|nr:hypothetical protein [Alteromonadaceae bacterium]